MFRWWNVECLKCPRSNHSRRRVTGEIPSAARSRSARPSTSKMPRFPRRLHFSDVGSKPGCIRARLRSSRPSRILSGEAMFPFHEPREAHIAFCTGIPHTTIMQYYHQYNVLNRKCNPSCWYLVSILFDVQRIELGANITGDILSSTPDYNESEQRMPSLYSAFPRSTISASSKSKLPYVKSGYACLNKC